MSKKRGFKLAAILIVIIVLLIIILLNAEITGLFTYKVSSTYKLVGSFMLFAVFILICLNYRNQKGLTKDLLWFIAVFSGLYALFVFIPQIDIALTIITLSFGIMAIIWTIRARSILSKGSSLRKHVTNFFFCLLFILLASTWDSLISLLDLEGFYVYPKYALITIAYFFFVYTAYRILKLGKEFGFSEDAERIRKTVQRKKRL